MRKWQGDPAKWHEVERLIDPYKMCCETCGSMNLAQAVYFGDPDLESVTCHNGHTTDKWDAMKAYALRLWEQDV